MIEVAEGFWHKEHLCLAVPDGTQVQVALDMAGQIAKASQPILMLAKEAVNKSFETHLVEGIHLERRLLYATLATERA